MKKVIEKPKKSLSSQIAAYSSEAKKNKMIISRCFFTITAIWFLLSSILGWLSSLFWSAPRFLYFIYANYHPYVLKYDAFCLSIFYAVIFLPCAVFFYWKKGFYELYINKHKWLASSIIMTLGVGAVLAPPNLQNSGKYVALARFILAMFDWLGALFISFMGLYLIALAIVIAFLSDKNTRG